MKIKENDVMKYRSPQVGTPRGRPLAGGDLESKI